MLPANFNSEPSKDVDISRVNSARVTNPEQMNPDQMNPEQQFAVFDATR